MKTLTAEDLNAELSAVFRDMKSGKVRPAAALEMTRAAFCIQSNVRLQLLNARMRNEVPNLAYFGNKKAAR